MPRVPILVLLLLAPLVAGCIADDAAPAQTPAAAESAEAAGAVAGPAPAAPKSAYVVQPPGSAEEGALVVHPVAIQTNSAKAPYVQEFTGTYSPQDCGPTGGGAPLGALGLASSTKRFDVSEAFARGDVFSYDVSLMWTNTDQSWGELHLWHQFDGVNNYWSEPTSDARGEVVLNFSGQGFIVSEEFTAFVGVDCWYGLITQPIPFTIVLTVTFAEGALPAAVPVLLRAPEGATRLFASGVALDPSAPVLSHYRVFAPDDSLVCECALNSDETLDVLELPGPGDYVVLVDHTANGFVALGLDAPPEQELIPLGLDFVTYALYTSDGESGVDETIVLDLPSTPLDLFAWVDAPGETAGPPDVGAGHNVKVTVSNGRGEVLRISLVGYATFHAAVPGVLTTNDWYGLPIPGDWEFYVDHHALAPGPHSVHFTADQVRGDLVLFASHYARP